MTAPLPANVVKERKPKLEPIPETHREAIDEFLRHFLIVYERPVNELRALAMQYRDSRYENELTYARHRVATIKALIAYNEQRKRRV